MSYESGFAAVKEASERSGQSYGNIAHPVQAAGVLAFKDKPVQYVRFLTNDPLVFPMHRWVKGANGKQRDYACTNFLQGELKRPCWICENVYETKEYKGVSKTALVTPKKTTISLAVLRDEKGNDLTKEVEILIDPNDPEGDLQKVTAPAFVIVTGGQRFWDEVMKFYFEEGTVTNQDLKITRSGEKLDTKYAAFGKNADGATQEELWEAYDLPAVEGVSDPAKGVAIEWMERRGTEAYYAALTAEDGPEASTEESAEAPSSTPAWTPSRKAAAKPDAKAKGFTALKADAQKEKAAKSTLASKVKAYDVPADA